ncbi:chaperone modulator CbpM [Chryseobacterium fistulae]|uniref:MerR family transcriptional regulator n=1 Tax=Chryseobacterium fistulae TaxID=2675058 RepID=A0A6N4XZH7_9FLAO|nr:chaperone modulator CbpM [Chryseobacterium fistulae]CAA7391412.1 hypothetical protein CHRY9393_02909 [Chryseobacterium fistulae]
MSERISREELVKIYNVEISFFDDLVACGLLEIVIEDNINYLMYDDLSAFEKLTNLHYDLDINLPGLEVIHCMLKKIEDLKNKNRELVNKIYLIGDKYENI